MRKILTATLVVAAICTVAAAQELKNELSGTIGHTFIRDQVVPNTNFFDNTAHFGKGIPFEINYSRQLRYYGWGMLAVEVPTIINLDNDLNYGLNLVPSEYKSIFLTPAGRVTFLRHLPFSP